MVFKVYGKKKKSYNKEFLKYFILIFRENKSIHQIISNFNALIQILDF
jgi:hypothetical protein